MTAFVPWIILFLPLAAALGIAVGALNRPTASAKLSIGAIVIGFILSLLLFQSWVPGTQPLESAAVWLQAGPLTIEFGWQLDRLTMLMLLIVTGVGSAIHIYSWGYLREDRGLPRYFASLSFFTFSMLGIVLANNFVQLFMFWELVGLASYLLIGFWHERPAAADAAKKAFLTNRLGDFGFLLGIILIWSTLGSLNFGVLAGKLAANPLALGTLTTIAGLLVFCGVLGKSAQFPLHVWLPDAMEGPTPVSALIHAATMVAAGIFLLCRVYFLFAAEALWPAGLAWLTFSAADVVAWVGGVTALIAALIAVQQNDLKRILAYSTLSQLGYMVMAVGLRGPAPALYHLTTHAFFKALLFLGAGSVIVALHHEQDIWRMGGLRKKMPLTFWTFLAGTLALCGVPPCSGFFSKDEILAVAYAHQPALFAIAVLVASLTALYMFRLVLVAFGGAARSPAAQHAQESPAVMTWPLLGLAVPSVLAGFWGIDRWLEAHFESAPGLPESGWWTQITAPFAQAPEAAYAGLAALVCGILAAWSFYGQTTSESSKTARRRQAKPAAKAKGGVPSPSPAKTADRESVLVADPVAVDPLAKLLGAAGEALRRRLYFDEVYARLIALTQDNLAAFADAFDRWVLSGTIVRGIHGTTELIGRVMRLLQTGNLQTYALLLVAGGVALLFWVFRH
jgi:NADH-quinone oxidoreductase subunit L